VGQWSACEIANDLEFVKLTHPLPQVVLTSSKLDSSLLRQSLSL